MPVMANTSRNACTQVPSFATSTAVPALYRRWAASDATSERSQ